MPTTKLTASLEDYLEVIFNLLQEKDAVKPIEVSKNLGVGKSSVSEALRNLAQKELINYAPYGVITLTPKGEKLAKEVALKHEVLTFFLTDVLNIEREEAVENACRIEHTISQNVYDQLVKFLKGYNQLPDNIKQNII